MQMSEPMRDHGSVSTTYALRISDSDFHALGKSIFGEVVRIVSEKIAADFVAEHGTEVLAKMSVEAIATLAVAAAGAAINETLHKKMPDKIIEIVKQREPIVLQRGIFGGVKRV